VHDSAVTTDVSPQGATAVEQRRDLAGADLQHFEAIAGETATFTVETLRRRRPLLVVLVDIVRTDDEQVDVAFGVGLTASERTERHDAQRRQQERGGQTAELLEHGVGSASQRQDRPRRHVILNESEQRRRWHLPPLEHAERDQAGQHARRLDQAPPGELSDGPQVQLGGGLGQHGKDATLRTRHDRLHRPHEVHGLLLCQAACARQLAWAAWVSVSRAR
jgi:hypothetical protein